MAFVTRIKRWLNKSTGGAGLTDYSLNEIELNKLSDNIERMITVFNDLYGDIVVSGGLETGRSLLVNTITACLAYGKGNRVEQTADIGHTYAASTDTYIHLDVVTSGYTFNQVGNGAGAPALGANEIAIIKIVTDGTQITSTVDLANRVLNGKIQTGPVNYVVGGGTANAHTAAFTPPFTALVDGMQIKIKPVLSNLTADATFKLDSLAAKPINIKTPSGLISPGIGSIGGGQSALFTYLLSSDIWILENPATSVTTTAANIFTADQTIRSAGNAVQIIDATTGVPVIKLRKVGANEVQLTTESNDTFNIRTSAGVSKFGFNVATGIMDQGIVPLARMGTVKLDANSVLGSNTLAQIVIQLGSSTHKFYVTSIRNNTSATRWALGSVVGVATTVIESQHSFIRRGSGGAGGDDVFEIVNGEAGGNTANYKLYELTEI